MILQGNALSIPLADESVNCVVSSPPYFGLRSYLDANDPLKGHELGAESTPAEYVAHLVQVFREVKRVLKSDGTVWLVLGDTYCSRPNGPNMASSTLGGSLAPHAQFRMAHGLRKTKLWPGLKPKDLIGIPWRVAFALQEDGWWLRSDIIWAKPNPMPESVTDRPTRSHEYVFLLSKSARYYYDAKAIAEEQSSSGIGGFTNKATLKSVRLGVAHAPSLTNAINDGVRNARSVWTIATQPTPMAHFATFPQELAKRCILAGCPPGGVVLDPFSGSGTTVFVATGCGRQGIGLELKMEYCQMGTARNGML